MHVAANKVKCVFLLINFVFAKGLLFEQGVARSSKKMNPFCIQKATLVDLPQLGKLLGDSPVACLLSDSSKPTVGMRLLLEDSERGLVFVARKGGDVMGMVSLGITISTAEGGYVLLVEDLVVEAGSRNQGVGSMLLDHTVRYAKDNGFLRMTLLSERMTEAGRRFFAKRSFVDSEMIPMRLVFSPQEG